jgi:hypothetical protein
MDKCYELGKYQISVRCLKSYPCQHSITNTHTGVTKILSGDKIYEMLTTDGLREAHFDKYNPHNVMYKMKQLKSDQMPVEEKSDTYLQMEMYSKQIEDEYTEKQRVTNIYKASTYIERLKNKHLGECTK